MASKKAKHAEAAHAEHSHAANSADRKEHSKEHSEKSKSSIKEHFANKDLVWIVVGVILFLLLGYAVIHYNVVSQDDYLSNMSKYNATPAQVGISGQQTSGTLAQGVSVPAHVQSVVQNIVA